VRFKKIINLRVILMKNEIYLKNYRALKEYCKYIFDEIADYKSSDEEFDVYSYEMENGNTGLYLDYGERGIVQLGSQYKPEKYAKVWIDRWIKNNPFEPNSTIICFGLGSGEYVKELFSRLGEENVLVIYEPSLKILDTVLRTIDLSEMITDRVTIISGTKAGRKEFRAILGCITNYSYFSMVRYYDLPNYPRIFREKYNEYKQDIIDSINSMTLNVNTCRGFSKISYKNILYSLDKALDTYSINSLYENLPQEKPAIIISAGPSLEKNIDELKRAKGKAFLVATDTALKPLLKHNIIPDIYVTVDPDKMLELFDDEMIKNIPVVATFNAKKDVIEANRNKVFFDFREPIFQKIIKRVDSEGTYGMLVPGGSVATVAFSFLVEAKMSPIIFVGQDLAYTGNKKHVSGAFKGDQSVSEKDMRNTLYVEDINGEMVLTDKGLNSFRGWFEDSINLHPENRYIDATEGGARIAGTEIMKLKDVIDNECVDEINFEEKIASTKMLFTSELRKKYYEQLIAIADEIDDVRDACNDLLDCYKNIEKISGSDTILKEDLVNIFAKIKKYTTYLDEDTILMPLLDNYMSIEDAFSNLHGKKMYEDIHEELKDLSGRAIMKVQSLIDGLGELEPVILEFVEKIRNRYQKEYCL